MATADVFCESVDESNCYPNGSLVGEAGGSDISVLSTTPKLIIFISLFPIGYRSKQTQTQCQWERAQNRSPFLRIGQSLRDGSIYINGNLSDSEIQRLSAIPEVHGLFLNIFTTKSNVENAENKLVPVMVCW